MDKDQIVRYLEAWGDLDRYYVFVSENLQPGLIHVIDANGESSALMDDDDERVVFCIKFLKDRGNPVFSNSDDVDAFISQFRLSS